jgi:hypothetical protein
VRWTRLHRALPVTNSGLHQPLGPGVCGGAADGALARLSRHPVRSGDQVADHRDKLDQATHHVAGPDKACGHTAAGAEPQLQAQRDEKHEIAGDGAPQQSAEPRLVRQVVGVEHGSNLGDQLGEGPAAEDDAAQREEDDRRPEEAVGDEAPVACGEVDDMGRHHDDHDRGQNYPTYLNDQPRQPPFDDSALLHSIHLFLGVLTCGNQVPQDESVECVSLNETRNREMLNMSSIDSEQAVHDHSHWGGWRCAWAVTVPGHRVSTAAAEIPGDARDFRGHSRRSGTTAAGRRSEAISCGVKPHGPEQVCFTQGDV